MPGELLELVGGYRISQAIHVAATLGLGDLLADSPRSSGELAEATDCHSDALYRLLRTLAALGVLDEQEGRRFGLTELGRGLRSDAPESIQGWAAFIGRPHHWQVWGDLLHSVRTGENAFRHVHGTDPWTYRAAHPEESAIFDRAMQSLTARTNEAVLAAYDFGRFGTVVDVGGGNGTLLAAILGAHPAVQGVLFDQPHVVAGAVVGDRCEIVDGSFFEAVPEGADAYVLKAILHDWEDEECRVILRVIRAAAGEGAALLVIERLLGPPNEGAETKLSDLNMLTGPGGRERTFEHFGSLFEAAGFPARRRPRRRGWARRPRGGRCLRSHATVLQVPDVRAALAWFRDALGFEVEPYEDGTQYGYASRGDVHFDLASPRGGEA